MDRLGDFEGIVPREQVYGGLDFGIFENFGRDLVESSGVPSRRSCSVILDFYFFVQQTVKI